MGLSVIGAGFWRMGTMSLKVALEQLGFGPCHHTEELFADPAQQRHWHAAIAGETMDWDAVFKGYHSTTDYPGAYYWRELAEFYPDAKVILTTRSVDSWWESYSNTVMRFLQNVPEDAPAHIRGVSQISGTLIGEKTFGSFIDDKKAGYSAFEDHIEKVCTSISSDRLLRFEVGDGWAPLCKFLGTPVPDGEFPRTNSTQEFSNNFTPTG